MSSGNGIQTEILHVDFPQNLMASPPLPSRWEGRPARAGEGSSGRSSLFAQRFNQVVPSPLVTRDPPTGRMNRNQPQVLITNQ